MNLRNDDLEPGLPAEEREALKRVALLLENERPIPAAGFRGELSRRLLLRHPAQGGVFGTRRLAVVSFVSGLALLLVAALGLTDLGPLAPSHASDAAAWIAAAL